MNIIKKPRINLIQSSLLFLAIILLTVIGFALIPRLARAATVGPPGCSPEKPYNCTLSREKFDQLKSQWCSLANSDKQDECKDKFFTFVYREPWQLERYANYSIPQYCASRFDGSRSPADEQRVPTFCYVIAGRGSDYYEALKKIIEDCGTADNQDMECVRRIQQQFLHDFNEDWADAPGPVQDSTGSGDAINTENEGAKTKFVERVSSYIKWFSLGLGILAVFGLIISGIQYAAAQDNPQAVAGAKTRIYNIVIGIVIYAFMFGLLQWLIPGGVFSL